jgi:hypothetical protein
MNFGAFVPTTVLTAVGAHSCPAAIAANIAWRNASSALTASERACIAATAAWSFGSSSRGRKSRYPAVMVTPWASAFPVGDAVSVNFVQQLRRLRYAAMAADRRPGLHLPIDRRSIQNWSRKTGQIRPSRVRRAMLSSSAPRIVFGRKGLNEPLSTATTPSPRPCAILRISKRSRRPTRLLRSMTSSPSHGCQNGNVEGHDSVPYRRTVVSKNCVAQALRSSRTRATLIHERHRFRAAHVAGLKPIELKAGLLDQCANAAIKVAATADTPP